MYGRTFIFTENFHINNLSVVLEIFMCLIFVGQGYPQKLLNLEHFPIYGISIEDAITTVEVPQSSLCFSDQDMQTLKLTIDPCASSDNYGIDIYEQTLHFIENLNTI